MFAADWDGDGVPDVLSAAGSSSQVAWYEKSDDAFTAHSFSPFARDVRSISAVDLNGDGLTGRRFRLQRRREDRLVRK